MEDKSLSGHISGQIPSTRKKRGKRAQLINWTREPTISRDVRPQLLYSESKQDEYDSLWQIKAGFVNQKGEQVKPQKKRRTAASEGHLLATYLKLSKLKEATRLT